MLKTHRLSLTDYWSPVATRFSVGNTAPTKAVEHAVSNGRGAAGLRVIPAAAKRSIGNVGRSAKSRTNARRVTRVRGSVLVSIKTDTDITAARRRGRAFARKLRFTRREQTVIAAAISEVARNIIGRSTNGQITIRGVRSTRRRGIEIIARDKGPRIVDIEKALQYGTSTGGIGTGLAGARLLMDQFQIQSRASKGTLVTMRKWLASELHA